ncbi:flagellar type III secretion system pore protein FliP [Sneathiella sp. P13V-1]|uniref:flagellar type III secretion system pore protein FliP n=1 Tax=Sneathiella sp. P13V-1 TaxID=2697366 RepID=UPI00187B1D2F|nr:flagellar type III secretion system pore protein FliP [Sneathiella sp. P13V-1]MBE7638364.1 flagellar type III secretion system pore protein FliP [Sneathiella sp. P13V-1]
MSVISRIKKVGLKRASLYSALLAIALTPLFAVEAIAQSLTLDLGDEAGPLTGRIVQIVVLMTVLSLAPAILIVTTSFTRLIVVLSLLRSALGIQTTPPNVVIISLALFLTGFIMAPTLESAYQNGVLPLVNEEIDEEEAFVRIATPFQTFMLKHAREKDVQLFMDLSATENVETPEAIPLKVLIPAFMISELKRAFEIGFLLFIPFLVIDMVVASILMSMGMMMLPPVMIALPFKLIFFVLVDGWNLVAKSLVESFAAGAPPS